MRNGMILFTILLFVSACSYKTNIYTDMMIFQGENEHWSAVYKIETKDTEKGTEADHVLEIQFKNMKNEAIDGEVEYTLEYTGSKLYGRQQINQEGKIIEKGTRTLNAALPKNEVTLKITWNGKTENLVLTK